MISFLTIIMTLCSFVLVQGGVVLMTIGVVISMIGIFQCWLEECEITDEKNDPYEKEWLYHRVTDNVRQFKIASKYEIQSDGFKPVNDNIILILQFLLLYKEDLTFEQAKQIVSILREKEAQEAKEAEEAEEAQEAQEAQKAKDHPLAIQEQEKRKPKPRKIRSCKRVKRYMYETRYQPIFEPRLKHYCRKGKIMKPRLDYVSRRSVPP